MRHFRNISFINVQLLFIFFLMTACTGNSFFEENTEINNRSWDINQPAVFKVNIDDTISRYNVYVNVRNTSQYRFSNLYIFLETTYPQNQIEQDTLDLTLAADDGRWKGTGLGDLMFNQFLFAQNVGFPQKGTYTFQLTQGMRNNPLQGIADVGIRIEKTTPQK